MALFISVMSDERISLKGKSDVLKYLAGHGIPVPKVYGSLNLASLVTDTPERVILRSDHPGEVDGFEGIFDSPILGMKTDSLERYCQQKGLEIEEVLSHVQLMVQEHLRYGAIGRMYVHPHDSSRLFVACSLLNQKDRECKNPAYHGDLKIQITTDETGITHKGIPKTRNEGWNDQYEPLDRALEEILPELTKLYQRVSALDTFDDGYSWEMEFGLGLGIVDVPLHVLQMRRFRKKEQATYTLDPSTFDPQRTCTIDTVFGITPQEGILVNRITTRDIESGNETYIKLLRKTPGKNLLIAAPAIRGVYIPAEAFSKINVLETIHGTGVLDSHTSFRTAKDIPIILFSHQLSNWLYSNSNQEIGAITPMKTYSDGRTAVVEKV